ncbi:MAG: 1-acyl-sn-glycerol-3-phosphate acyltransferase [Chitinophagaceae bacterium]|jgi:1-acyl-sn-glycerol-3-phosphate acyltransferase|nr:1-acyl-sn-glycerol-3-phosphate acyltransferase [Chitinophagaceae bacterium]
MLYGLLKIWVRIGLPFFAKSIRITGHDKLATRGPLVLAVNHPNSFFDAILLGAFMQHPVHFHTRGDVFKKSWVRRLLTRINMLPVYRLRDGKDKLSLNQQTFEKSEAVLNKNGILLVFVEGFCEYQTTLQLPLKKGAPRVIDACWRKGLPVQVLPVWLYYSSFRQYGKRIEIHLGEVIPPLTGIDQSEPSVVWQKINQQMAEGLATLEQKANLGRKPPGKQRPFWLMLPAMLGAILHAPLYLPVQAVVYRFTSKEVHYDSVLLAVLLLLYPLYLLLLSLALAFAAGGWWFFMPLLLLPALARAFVCWK